MVACNVALTFESAGFLLSASLQLNDQLLDF